MNDKSQQRQRILAVSEELFLEYGYRGVTMRQIATKLGMSLGNAYNYFRSKEEIFEAILRPVLETLEYLFCRHNDEERISTDIFYDSKLTMLEEYAYFIHTYRRELALLMNQSAGSKYEHYRDYFVRRNLQLSQEYLEQMHQKYPELRTEFSPHFVRYIVIAWYDMIGYLIGEDLSPQEIVQFMSDYLAYTSGGWKKLMYP